MALKTMEWDFGAVISLAQLATNVKDVAVAAGWELAEPTIFTSGVIGTNSAYATWIIKKDFSDAVYTDETAWVAIRAYYYSGQSYIILELYEDYDLVTHTPFNLVSMAAYSYAANIPYQTAGTLVVSAGDKHIFVATKNSNGEWYTYRSVVFGADRLAYDTMDLNDESNLVKSIRTWHMTTYNCQMVSPRIAGAVSRNCYSLGAPAAGVSEHVDKVVLHRIPLTYLGADPLALAQTVQYRFGYAAGIRYILAEGAGELNTTVVGMCFPSMEAPEYMLVTPGLLVPWCLPNVIGS